MFNAHDLQVSHMLTATERFNYTMY